MPYLSSIIKEIRHSISMMKEVEVVERNLIIAAEGFNTKREGGGCRLEVIKL